MSNTLGVENKITIYGKSGCAGCDQAKAFLERRLIPYEYVNIQTLAHSGDDGLKEANNVISESGMKSVPIIKVGDIYIGGLYQLMAYIRGKEKNDG